MKFKIKDGHLELETITLRSICLSCGKYLGSAEAIKETVTIGYQIESHPLCHECFKEKVGKINDKINFDAKAITTI